MLHCLMQVQHPDVQSGLDPYRADIAVAQAGRRQRAVRRRRGAAVLLVGAVVLLVGAAALPGSAAANPSTTASSGDPTASRAAPRAVTSARTAGARVLAPASTKPVSALGQVVVGEQVRAALERRLHDRPAPER